MQSFACSYTQWGKNHLGITCSCSFARLKQGCFLGAAWELGLCCMFRVRRATDRRGKKLLVLPAGVSSAITQLYLANSNIHAFLPCSQGSLTSSRRPHNLFQPMCLHAKVQPLGRILLEVIIFLFVTCPYIHSSFSVVQALVATCTMIC